MSYQEQQDAIKSKVVGVANDVADRMSNVADHAARQGGAAKREIVDAANGIAQRASDALDDAGINTDSLGKALSSSLDSLARSLRQNVRDRPLGAIAVTAAIGLLIGAMSNR